MAMNQSVEENKEYNWLDLNNYIRKTSVVLISIKSSCIQTVHEEKGHQLK